MNDRGKILSHGQLLVDFANASSPDEAMHSLFENMQRIYGFSEGFVERAKKSLPSWKEVENLLTNRERARVKVLCMAKKLTSTKPLKIRYKGYNEPHRTMVGFYVLYRFPKEIDKIQSSLISLFKYLSSEKSLYKNEYFRRILSNYGYYPGVKRYSINADGSIKVIDYFSEEKYFEEYPDFSIDDFRSPLPCERFITISSCELLLNGGRHHIKECPYCEKFFIAKDTKRQRCYSRECEKDYQRDRKRKQREKDPVKYYSKPKDVP